MQLNAHQQEIFKTLRLFDFNGSGQHEQSMFYPPPQKKNVLVQ